MNTKLVDFRGARIPKTEADLLKSFEEMSRNNRRFEKFKLYDRDYFKHSISPGFFVESNRVAGLKINFYELKSLKEIFEIFSSLHSLDISNCNINSWDVKHSTQKLLKELRLSYLNLTELPVDFSNSPQVIEVDLSYNKFKKFPSSLKKLKNLEVLNLSGNRLNLVPSFIGKFKKLRILNLAGNDIKELPNNISDLIALEKLYLYNNKIGKLPKDIGRLKSLTELDLFNGKVSYHKDIPPEGNHISELPDSFIQLTSLERLNLGNNDLSILPLEFGNLRKLKELFLEHNKLSSFPDSIGEIETLQFFDVTGNKLTSIPDSIGNIKSLQILRLGGNLLKIIPDSIGNLTLLKQLELSGNKNMTSLPDSIKNLKKLRKLGIRMMHLDNESYQKVPLLQRKTRPKTSKKSSFPPEDMEDSWSDISSNSWSIISPKDLKAFGLASNKISIKCELCGIDIKDQVYEDHLRSCIYNIGFNIGNVGLYHRTIQLIKKHIGSNVAASYLNSFSPGYLNDFFWPHIEKGGPIFFPIDGITDIITSGLVQQKNDKEFYNDVILLLIKFFNILKGLISYQGMDPNTSFYATSILNLFNKIYEKNYDKYILNLKPTLENFISSNKKKIAHCWFRFRDIKTRPLFYEENLLFDELLDDMVDDPNAIKVIKILNNAVPKYLNIDTYDDVNVITKNKKVVCLYLRSLNLESLPESISYLKELEILHIFSSQLKFIPDTLSELLNLKELRIIDAKFSIFPKCLCGISSLLKLTINGTQINEIPSSLRQLSNLEVLELSNNKLKEITSSISQLTKIRDLDFSKNVLITLPKSMGKLQSLNTLNLSFNNLISLPKSIGKLTSLQYLNLQGHKIKQFPKSILDLPRLWLINIRTNKLKKLEYIEIIKFLLPLEERTQKVRIYD